MSDITDIPKEKVKDLFCGDSGYQTPKIDTRAAIFKDGRILLVHERHFPAAGASFFSPSARTPSRKSVRRPVFPPKSTASSPFTTGKGITLPTTHTVSTLCHVTGGSFEKNIKTTGFDWFAEDELPPLAVAKNSEEQVRMCFEAYRAGDEWKVRFD